jgi:hypothetical protein
MTKSTSTANDLTPTAISDADPAVVTVASTTGMTEGDIVAFSQTGFTELDDKVFTVGTITATTFEVTGADTSTSSGVLGASPVATYYKQAEMVGLCLSGITVDNPVPTPIDISTFCVPGASLPGNPQPGTVTITGYVDVADEGYDELVLSERDGEPRMLDIQIPSNGDLVGEITIGSVSFSLPLEGAAGFEFNAAMATPLAHRY